MDTMQHDIEQGVTLLESQNVTFNGIQATIQVTATGLAISHRGNHGAPSAGPWMNIPLSEIFYVKTNVSHKNICLIYTFGRSRYQKAEWYPKLLRLCFETAREQEDCTALLQNLVREESYARPKRLLFIVNPVSGSGKALSMYYSTIKPFFAISGTECTMVETVPAGMGANARFLEQLNRLKYEYENKMELSFDGVVAIGGDGVFYEMVNLVSDLFEGVKGQGVGATLSSNSVSPLRLAHIPCGSTDAMATSLHGTRSVFTAMMHIALGDAMNIDALEVELGPNRKKLSLCIATCGFMADVIKDSASPMMRVLGPVRYDLTGAMKLFQNKSYHCRIRYVEAAGQDSQMECKENCPKCGDAIIRAKSTASLQPCEWIDVEGHYLSVMIMNQACVSEKTKSGMYRYGHLSNGESILVMVKQCSAFHFFSFLHAMASHGLASYNNEHIQVIPVIKVEVTALGGESLAWNLDGELEHANRVTATPRFASLPVFARGPT